MSKEKSEGKSTSQSEAAQDTSDQQHRPIPTPATLQSSPSPFHHHTSSSNPPSTTAPHKHQTQTTAPSSTTSSPPKLADEHLLSTSPPSEPLSPLPLDERKVAAIKRDQPSASTSPSTLETTYAGAGSGAAGASSAVHPHAPSSSAGSGSHSHSRAGSSGGQARQVIAVSASKGPAAFFNLARKFLVTDEMCDLSALEGAIVSAVDAAHLLERSKLATIVKVQTSYVAVEPKRRKQQQQVPSSTPTPTPGMHPMSPIVSPAAAGLDTTTPATPSSTVAMPAALAQHHPLRPSTPPLATGVTESLQQHQQQRPRRASSGRELRRARIVITVKRTESYKRWLDDNPLQAIIAGDGGGGGGGEEPDDDKAAAAGD